MVISVEGGGKRLTGVANYDWAAAGFLRCVQGFRMI